MEGEETQLELPIAELLNEDQREKMRAVKRAARKGAWPMDLATSDSDYQAPSDVSVTWKCTHEGCNRVFDTPHGRRIHELRAHRGGPKTPKLRKPVKRTSDNPSNVRVDVLEDGRVVVSLTVTMKRVFSDVAELYACLAEHAAEEVVGNAHLSN